MRAAKALTAKPGWITSAGALVAIVLGILTYTQNAGVRAEGTRRADRSEIKADMRRELELACACCKPGVTSGVR